jgi:hypothetical protein
VESSHSNTRLQMSAPRPKPTVDYSRLTHAEDTEGEGAERRGGMGMTTSPFGDFGSKRRLLER